MPQESAEKSKQMCIDAHKLVLRHLDKAAELRLRIPAKLGVDFDVSEARRALADIKAVTNEVAHSLSMRIMSHRQDVAQLRKKLQQNVWEHRTRFKAEPPCFSMAMKGHLL